MFGLDNPSGINAMPAIAPKSHLSPLWFTEGGAGLSPSYPGQDWFNQIQAEMLNILKLANVTPEKDQLDQVAKAIESLVSGAKIEVTQTTGTSTEKVMSQDAVTKALQAAASIAAIYPIGIVTWFAQNKDPNKLFPGTTWKYIGENKTIRLANANGANVLTTGGADTVTLTEAQLPAHNHSFSASTSSFDYGTKTTNSAGSHNHGVTADDAGSGSSNFGRGNNNRRGINQSAMALAGDHTHTVAIGAHSHTLSGTTGNKGSGSTITIINAYIMLMAWYRIG